MDLKKLLFRLLTAMSATSMMLIIYLLVNKIYILKTYAVISVIIYLCAEILLTFVCLLTRRRLLLKENGIRGKINRITIVSGEYIISFLGFFFVALSIENGNWLLFWSVWLMVTFFAFNSQSVFFNPIFIVFGYNFYKVETNNGTEIYVISKKKNIKSTDNLTFSPVLKINEFTYFDEEMKE